MDRICVVDTSIPAYASPTARECYVMIGASAESLEVGLLRMADAGQTAALCNVAGVVLVCVTLIVVCMRRGVRP